MIVVGMDVHVRNSFLHAADDQGRRLVRGRYGNTPGELRAFCDDLLTAVGGDAQPVRFVMESTTNSRAVQQMVRQAARHRGFETIQAEVLDARKLRVIAESVAKCDALDAQVLSNLARANLRLPTCYIPDEEEFALREHLRARSDLVRIRTTIKNRIHALLHRRGILTPARGLFTRAGSDFRQGLELDEAGRAILSRYEAALAEVDAHIAASNRDLQTVMRRPRWAKPAALLQTMPGVGPIVALTLLAELGDLRRFKSRAAVANYAGLVPVVRDSNTKHYRGGITRRGSAHLRHVLTEAAWVALPRVPFYTALFKRVEQRKGKQVAIVAVARRMVEDAARLLWKEEAFRWVPVGADRPLAGAPHRGHPVASSVAG